MKMLPILKKTGKIFGILEPDGQNMRKEELKNTF